MPQDFWANALFSVTPTILLGVIFAIIIVSIVRADRSERTARARIEAEERARAAAEDELQADARL